MASLGSEQIAVTTGKAAIPIQFVDVTACGRIIVEHQTLVPDQKCNRDDGRPRGFIDYNVMATEHLSPLLLAKSAVDEERV